MTTKLRDQVAIAAMQELLKRFNPEKYTVAHICKDAYAIADAMVVEGSK